MAPVQIPTIVVPKSSDVLASTLRRQILIGAIEPGQALPPERDLVAQSGLSRGSVREALRLLEAENLIRTRPGRLGGSVVSRPDDSLLVKYVSLFAHSHGVKLWSLLQAREAVEPSLAALAAENRTEAELQHLVEVTERCERSLHDVPLFLQENVEWHCAIAVASHNELLRAFIVAISSLIHRASAIENFATDDVRAQVVKAHRRILDAITARDAQAARRRMARNLNALTEAVKAFPNVPLVLD